MMKTVMRLAVACGAACAVWAAPADAVAPDPRGPVREMSDAREIEAFVDGAIDAQLKSFAIAGATVSIVKDGQLLFAKGYGYADLEKRKPVVADQTLFRVGSIGKLFTATAAMQLAEQGKLDLHADVNRYLDFTLPATFPEPITMTHLLTHSAGFEASNYGMSFAERAQYARTRDVLVRHLPARIRPPGQESAYSNLGLALAGYIIARVSGQPFEDYVQDHILAPLGMSHSTFKEPLTGALLDNMANGYVYENGRFVKKPFENIRTVAAAGSLSATATDMARFMIMHLQNGRFGDRVLLQEKTARLMHSRQMGRDERVGGFAYGFYQNPVNGLNALSHGGKTYYFNSRLMLLPDQNIGVFISYSSPPGYNAADQFMNAFLDRYFGPEHKKADGITATFPDSAHDYAGSYRANIDATTFQHVFGLFGQMPMTARDARTLVTGNSSYRQIGPGHFEQVAPSGPMWDTGALAFTKRSDGTVVAALRTLPMSLFYKLRWYETQGFALAVLGLYLTAFVTVVVTLVRHRAGMRAAGPLMRAQIPIILVSGLAAIAFLVALPLTLLGLDLYMEVPVTLTATLTLGVVAAIASVVSVVAFLATFRDGAWTTSGRLAMIAFFATSAVFFWLLDHWHVLGYRY